MAATHIGHCQICLRVCKLPGGLVARHGYRRPRWGHEVGHCLGGACLPWEGSCERAVWYLERLSTYLASDRVVLAKYESGEVDTLYRKSRVTGQQMLITKEDPTWELTLRETIRGVQYQITDIDRAGKALTVRIAAWKPGEPQVVHGIAV